MKATANSVIQKKVVGNVVAERYFDSNGRAYLEIDYTNHGNAKQHAIVPHQHVITDNESGKPIRGEGLKI